MEFKNKKGTEKISKQLLNHIHGARDVIGYMSNYFDSVFVIKVGNLYLSDPLKIKEICKDIALLHQIGIRVILVHGGGTFIIDMINKLKLEQNVINGHEITDEKILKVSEMTLCGEISQMLVGELESLGVNSLSISGKSCSCVTGEKVRKIEKDFGSNIEKILDLGFIADPKSLKIDFIESLLDIGLVLVFAPICVGSKHQTYTINGDVLAAFIATEMKAKKLIFISDDDGILDKNGQQIDAIDARDLNSMLSQGLIKESLVQKATNCANATLNGVGTAHVINGNIPGSLSMECCSDMGLGTVVSGHNIDNVFTMED